MSFTLPPNSWTITPHLRAPRSKGEASGRYGQLFLTAETARRAQSDLEELRRWDIYDRSTDVDREEAKNVIWNFLKGDQLL